MDEQIITRFDELIAEGDSILSTRRTGGGEQVHRPGRAGIGGLSYRTQRFDRVDSTRSIGWGMNCRTLLRAVFGDGSEYSTKYSEEFKRFDSSTSFNHVQKAVQILVAAKSDYELGFHLAPILTETSPNPDIASICKSEARRNTRIYLAVTLFVFLTFIVVLFAFFGVGITGVITIGLLIFSYFLSVLALKDFSPNKIHERLFEFEHKRIRRKFDLQ